MFDTLDPKTQVFALAHVLRHLSDPDLPSPDLYAWNEGTAYALFVTVEDELGTEIEFEQDPDTSDNLKFRIRRLIRDALEALIPRPNLRRSAAVISTTGGSAWRRLRITCSGTTTSSPKRRTPTSTPSGRSG